MKAATPVRRAASHPLLLSLLEAEENHLSAEAVCARLRRSGHGLSLSAVYRGLEALAEAGRVGVVRTRGVSLWERNPAPHAHLVCRGCGRVDDLPENPQLEAVLRTLETGLHETRPGLALLPTKTQFSGPLPAVPFTGPFTVPPLRRTPSPTRLPQPHPRPGATPREGG